ncbi:MAG: hypothetical protein HWE14_00075 [Flavobacteriia bacterium]|nr:hypothetical protein [Flavobacteriia bacterium]
MRTHTFLLILALFTFSVISNGQIANNYLSQEVYRSGSILNYTRLVDGVSRIDVSKESVGNVIYNIGYETAGVYSRFDLSLIPLILFNQDENQYFSYNITLGAYLNESPVEMGIVKMHYGVGVDLDLSTFVLNDVQGDRRRFESGTIGLNVRVDLEIGEYIQIRNSITRGWWTPDKANRWDIRSTIGVEVLNGLFLTVAPNYLFISNEKEEDSKLIDEKSSQFYISYGIGTAFDL